MELKEKLIESIRTAPSDLQLAEYLAKVAKALNPPKYESRLLTLYESFKQCLQKINTEQFLIELKNPRFKQFTEDFFLTPGLHIIAAPSGHGKTFWAMEWAKQAARLNYQVLMLSLEMSPSDLGARSIAENSDLALRQIMRQEFDRAKWLALDSLIEQEDFVWMKNIHIDNPGDYDWSKMSPRLEDLMLKIRPRLVIVDYAQMIYDSTEKDIRQSKVLGEIARDLKLFAEHTQSAVLLLSQMNREGLKEVRPQKIKALGYVPLANENVKESGAIVEAADSVQLICVPRRFAQCPFELHDKFQIIVDKSRRLGQLGVYQIDFDPDGMKWLN